jgi:hypothetical protein
MLHGRLRRVNRFLGAFREHARSKTSRFVETVGASEVERVRERYRVTVSSREGLVGDLFLRWVRRAGERYEASTETLPGSLPGVGWRHEELWAGPP